MDIFRVHAMSSGLKVYVSTAVVDDCETCRRACGGHGFAASAGLAAIYAHQLPATTYEGDNYILNQQVCRAAVKTYADSTKSRRKPAASSEHISFEDQMGSLLEARAAAMVEQLAAKKAKTREWTDLSWDCVSVAKAITEANICQHLKKATDGLQGQKAPTAEHRALINVYQVVGQRLRSSYSSPLAYMSSHSGSCIPLRKLEGICSSMTSWTPSFSNH